MTVTDEQRAIRYTTSPVVPAVVSYYYWWFSSPV
jgi:hypothetical protein